MLADPPALAGAEAVIIAGGPLAATARRLAELDPAPIIEPLPGAAALAIARVGAGVGLGQHAI
ncbi:hypothetical protein OHA18_20010 [Kribbella sp. NBC_00709]|uniref:hypothetical protein n=1 Tax=Kribbella sp. NBC_00709 TaxID=2975972 RepID=UPI002E2A4E6B|nr:hypothetical protein [Kribbella sp. NBC_00709]